MTKRILRAVIVDVLLLALAGCNQPQEQTSVVVSSWPGDIERTWVGPGMWANRLQDWRIANGRLECLEARSEKPMRTVHLLTHRLAERAGDVHIWVKTGLIEPGNDVAGDAAAGFLIGAGAKLDYRAAALIHHTPNTGGGLFAGIKADGTLFVADFEKKKKPIGGLLVESQKQIELPEQVLLAIHAVCKGERYSLKLTAQDAQSRKHLDTITLSDVAGARFVGNVALASHPGSERPGGGFWFEDWSVAGSKLEYHPERTCGPILSAQHTVSGGTLKLTAQMMPLGRNDNQSVNLQIKEQGQWKEVAAADIVDPGYTATFRIENWDESKDTPYRMSYELKQRSGATKEYTYCGIIKHNPEEKGVITVAGFTGNHNVRHPGVDGGIPWSPAGVWFPHGDIVEHVKKHKPDLLFFSGDQVYEYASPTVPEAFPPEVGRLDYLYRWYLWCWAFGELARDIPCVCIPDDHDVYQGNLFGCSGRLAPKSWHDGGYIWPAENVNMVQRTQTSNLPDAYEPAPVERGIGVYYCSMDYGGVSFAIIEDRKFKGDYNVVADAEIEDAHIVTDPYDVNKADVPGVPLLGERQERFLADWISDTTGSMRVLLSQTIFCNLQTRAMYHDKLDRDLDSNGWPRSGRNRALRILGRGNVFHLAGDQHLGSIVRHGVDTWDDSIWSFCVPSVANFYPRSWEPEKAGGNHQPGMPDYTGQYKDGFGNYITVWAAANPDGATGAEPRALHDSMPGYGIVKLNKVNQTITMECWPRYADPDDPETGSQYPGWPRTIEVGESR